MRSDNTYRAIITGMIILFTAGVIWLVVSRQRINALTEQLDEEKLRNESLLSEKLLIAKDLDKESSQVDVLSAEKHRLARELRQRADALGHQTNESKRLKTRLTLARESVEKGNLQIEELHSKLVANDVQLLRLEEQHRVRKDSIDYLTATITRLEAERDAAVKRSIDQTLIFAEKGNNKLTTKAKRINELVANVDLPSELNDLSFVVEGPDGAILSNTHQENENTVTVRQLTDGASATASLNSTVPRLTVTKRMEVVYTPSEKLRPGIYVIKIFNESEYVGSMQIALR
jgi:chromosome segregation ATPase